MAKRKRSWRSSNPLGRLRKSDSSAPGSLEDWLQSELDRAYQQDWPCVPRATASADEMKMVETGLVSIVGPDDTDTAGQVELRTLLSTVPQSKCGPVLAPEFIPPKPFWMYFIYWKEIDEMVQHARCVAHELFRRRASAVMGALAEPEVAAPLLRQVVEVSFWGASFQAGLSIAQASFWREVSSRGTAHYLSKEIEDYVRGWMASEEERLAKGWSVVGKQRTDVSPDQHAVTPSNPTVSKMRQITAYAASVIDTREGTTDLTTAVGLLENASSYLDGLTHITPTLIEMSVPSPSMLLVDHPPFRGLVGAVLPAAALVLERMVFAPRYDVSFLHIQHPGFPGPDVVDAPMYQLSIPELQDIREGAIRVAMDFGTERKIIARGQKRRKSKQSPKNST